MKGIEKSSRVMGLRRFSMVQLLIALALLFFFFPFVEEIKDGDIIVSLLLSFQPHLLPPAIFLVAGIGLVAFVVVNLLRFVLRAPSVDVEVLCASISAYLMLGLIWTMAYWLVDQLTPGAFAFNTTTGTKESMEGFNAFYFSFVTLSTVGYGDITPVSKVARMLAATEAMTGLLYVAVLIARLVGLYSTPKPP